MDADDRLTYSMKGSSPQGEEDTLPACRVLALHLRQQDPSWDEAQSVSGRPDLDCVIPRKDGAPSLNVQVVRAVVDQNLWRSLNSSGGVTDSLAASCAAGLLRAAIEQKATDRKIPKRDRGGITLALDARRIAGLTFDSVIECFVNDHGKWASQLGFKAIWLIGPVHELVKRLDGKSS
ncbi:MAG: hypothetical protein U1F76_02440 [Candidatus Competibacteraceae bacterium]